jgi:hypothetical protein
MNTLIFDAHRENMNVKEQSHSHIPDVIPDQNSKVNQESLGTHKQLLGKSI